MAGGGIGPMTGAAGGAVCASYLAGILCIVAGFVNIVFLVVGAILFGAAIIAHAIRDAA